MILCHTDAFTAAARQVHKVVRAEQQREVLRFEAIDVDVNVEDESSVASAGLIDTTALFADHLNSGLSRVFRTPTLRPKQNETIGCG